MGDKKKSKPKSKTTKHVKQSQSQKQTVNIYISPRPSTTRRKYSRPAQRRDASSHVTPPVVYNTSLGILSNDIQQQTQTMRDHIRMMNSNVGRNVVDTVDAQTEGQRLMALNAGVQTTFAQQQQDAATATQGLEQLYATTSRQATPSSVTTATSTPTSTTVLESIKEEESKMSKLMKMFNYKKQSEEVQRRETTSTMTKQSRALKQLETSGSAGPSFATADEESGRDPVTGRSRRTTRSTSRGRQLPVSVDPQLRDRSISADGRSRK